MNLVSSVLFLFFTFNSALATTTNSVETSKVIYLEPEETIHILSESKRIGFYTTQLRIYCYRGKPKTLPRFFQTVYLNLDIDNDDFTQYEGGTPEIVQEHYEEQTSIFFYFLSNKKTRLRLNPFNQTCIGIDTIHKYSLKLHVIRVDFWKVICLITGVIIFLCAGSLSHNALFYYLCGILLGIFASFLILVYLASKLMPRKPFMYGAVICGWSLAIYLLQILLQNIQTILVTYQNYVLWYVTLTGFISFVICYRFGPPENQRSKNLIKWGLQLIALIISFYSSEFQEASIAIVTLLIFLHYFPHSLLNKVREIFVRRFPQKPRLLTDEEYQEQGIQETKKALEELRKYASSPECKQWRVISKLKDPLKFASFVEGSSHVSDQEMLEYETSRAELTDSDLSEDGEENDYQEHQEFDDEISEDEEISDNKKHYNRPTRQLLKLRENGTVAGQQRLYSSYNQASTNKRQIYRNYNKKINYSN